MSLPEHLAVLRTSIIPALNPVGIGVTAELDKGKGEYVLNGPKSTSPQKTFDRRSRCCSALP